MNKYSFVLINRLIICLFYVVIQGACQPASPCASSSAACLDLEVQGAGAYAELRVILELDPRSALQQQWEARALPGVVLPAHLVLSPPDALPASAVRGLWVTAFDEGGVPQAEGRLDLAWPAGAHITATVAMAPYVDVDLRLMALSVSSGPLAPTFQPEQTQYDVQPRSPAGAVEVLARAFDPRARLYIQDTRVLRDDSPVVVALRASEDTQITVRVEDGLGQRREYRVHVPWAPRLTKLALAEATLSPLFSPEQAKYTASASALLAELTLSAVPSDPATRVSVGGVPVSSPDGTLRLPWDLSVGPTLRVRLDATNGVSLEYEVTVLLRPSQYLKAGNAAYGDVFGQSVALSGDTLVVGAMEEDSAARGVNGDGENDTAQGSGAVYVYTWNGTTWLQQAYLKASNTDPGDRFGLSVAIDGDTIAVGAIREDSAESGINGNDTDNSSTDSGAVYIFQRSGTTWSQQAYLKASNRDAFDYFGWSLALSGDTLVVGASREASRATGVNGNGADNGAPQSGAVYVFRRTGATWAQEAYLKASNSEALDYFGHSVAIDGDTVAVGAISESSDETGVSGSGANNNAPKSGAVYVFARTGGGWTQQAYLKASNTEADDWFGAWVSLSRDSLAVGAPNEDSAATFVNGAQGNGRSNSGAAYVFVRTAGVWSQQAYIKGPVADPNDNFGFCVALSQDTLAVSNQGDDSSATGVNGSAIDNSARDAGAVVVYERRGGSWRQISYLKAGNPDVDDSFGWAIALSGRTLVVTATNEDGSGRGSSANPISNNALNAGAAYVFR
jgi:hypothetical protein